jgi:Acetoacetate decarboxylase (ADC)
MTATLEPGLRYRMPAVFGPAPGPRQKADGTPWKPEETGTMHCRWFTVTYATERAQIEALLPSGFELRGEPTVSVSISEFKNLYWLAGRGYGIVIVDVPAIYRGKTQTIEGAFCPVMWEGEPDAIMTGREELGFPKLFADIPPLSLAGGGKSAAGSASWFGHEFIDMEVHDLVPVEGDKALPGSGGPTMYFKYMPRTSIGGREGADVSCVTSSFPPPGTPGDTAPIKLGEFQFKKWRGAGTVRWHRATFEQLPTTFHIINALADIKSLNHVRSEMVEFSGPGIGVSAGVMRTVD